MLSLFLNDPPVSLRLPDDLQDVAYHFDAVVRTTTEMKTKRTRYPTEFGADMQDHAYNEPTKFTMYGFTGSHELRFSVNQLPALGASAVIGAIDNPVVSAVAGVIGANIGYLGGSEETRASATLAFLQRLKEEFVRFDIVTKLTQINGLMIDSIHVPTDINNETGLEFVVEMSQQFVAGETADDAFSSANLPDSDTAKTMAATLLNRGRVRLG